MTNDPLTTAATAGLEATAAAGAAGVPQASTAATQATPQITTSMAPPAPQIDPNTMLAEAPKPPAQPIQQEQRNFIDEWAKAPDQAPPVRTWRDASERTGPEGQYVSAWYDTPVAAPAATPAPSPDQSAPAPAASPAPQGDYFQLDMRNIEYGDSNEIGSMLTVRGPDGAVYSLTRDQAAKLRDAGYGNQSTQRLSAADLQQVAGWSKPKNHTQVDTFRAKRPNLAAPLVSMN